VAANEPVDDIDPCIADMGSDQLNADPEITAAEIDNMAHGVVLDELLYNAGIQPRGLSARSAARVEATALPAPAILPVDVAENFGNGAPTVVPANGLDSASSPDALDTLRQHTAQRRFHLRPHQRPAS